MARELLNDAKVWLSRRNCDTVFLFSGIGEGNFALARDVMRTFPGGHGGDALIVFCNVTAEERDANSSTFDWFADKRWGKVAVTSRPLSEMIVELDSAPSGLVRRLLLRHPKARRVHCVAFSDNCTGNVETAVNAIETITRTAGGCHPDSDEMAIREARRYSVYCLHDSQEDELLFDSLVYGESSTGETLLSTRERGIRLSIEVRLVSYAEEQAMSLLTTHPLFDVLEDPRSKTSQELYVLVVGLEGCGLEILKAVYWIGRMRGVGLHVWGFDCNGGKAKDLLEVTCPEMMQETGPDGKLVVSIFSADPSTRDFAAVLGSLPRESKVYAVSALEEDRLNLNAALMMRRLFDNMLLEGTLVCPEGLCGNGSGFPVILPLIHSSELSEAAKRMTSDKNEAFRLEPFGRTDEVFSYQNVVDSIWERRALAMCAAYQEVWDEGVENRGTMATFDVGAIPKEYAQFEIKKLSNRANVRHIPYRLWSVGLVREARALREPDAATLLTNERCHDALSIDANGVRALLEQYRGSDNPGDTLLMRAEQDQLRAEHPLVCGLAELEHDR